MLCGDSRLHIYGLCHSTDRQAARISRGRGGNSEEWATARRICHQRPIEWSGPKFRPGKGRATCSGYAKADWFADVDFHPHVARCWPLTKGAAVRKEGGPIWNMQRSSYPTVDAHESMTVLGRTECGKFTFRPCKVIVTPCCTPTNRARLRNHLQSTRLWIISWGSM